MEGGRGGGWGGELVDRKSEETGAYLGGVRRDGRSSQDVTADPSSRAGRPQDAVS